MARRLLMSSFSLSISFAIEKAIGGVQLALELQKTEITATKRTQAHANFMVASTIRRQYVTLEGFQAPHGVLIRQVLSPSR